MLITELKSKFGDLDPFNKKDLISILKTDRFVEQYRDICKKEIDEEHHESFSILFKNTRNYIIENSVLTEITDLTLFSFIFLVDFFKESIIPNIMNLKALDTPEFRCPVMRAIKKDENEIRFDIEKIVGSVDTVEIDKFKYLKNDEIEKLFSEDSSDSIINTIIKMISSELIECIDKEIIEYLCEANQSDLRKESFDLKPPEGYNYGVKSWTENIIPLIVKMRAQTFVESNITTSNKIIIPTSIFNLLKVPSSISPVETDLIKDKILIVSYEKDLPRDTAGFFMYTGIIPHLHGDNYRFHHRSSLRIFKPKTIAEIKLDNLEFFNRLCF